MRIRLSGESAAYRAPERPVSGTADSGTPSVDQRPAEIEGRDYLRPGSADAGVLDNPRGDQDPPEGLIRYHNSHCEQQRASTGKCVCTERGYTVPHSFPAALVDYYRELGRRFATGGEWSAENYRDREYHTAVEAGTAD